MEYRFWGILRGYLEGLFKKPYIIIALLILSSISCSNLRKNSNELPKKIKYSTVVYENCNNLENSGYLCITEQNAVNSVLDLKKCQEQNKLLRTLLDGS
jgi:hypothetical protein